MSNRRVHLDAANAGVLLEMMDLTSGVADLDHVLEGTARFARDLSGADEAAVFLYDDGRRSVVPAAVIGVGGLTSLVGERIALRIGEGSIFWRMRTTEGVLEIVEPHVLQDVVDFSQFKRMYLAPMATGEGVLGVLLLGYRELRPSADSQLRRLFAALAKQAGVMISRAQLFSNLEKSEEQYRRLTENASDIVFTLDASGRFTFLNSRAFQILGYRPDELTGQYYSEIVTPESWDGTRQALRQCLEDGGTQVSYEWTAVSRSGDAILLDVRASVLMREGQYAGQQGIARDMTQQRRMEQEIRLSKRRQSEMRDYLALVTRVQEEERKRVARELHDDTAQALIALSRRLEMAVPYVSSDPKEACRRLEDLSRLTDNALANVRQFTRDLRPPVLDDLGLIPALEWLVSNMQEHNPIRGAVVVKGTPVRLPSDTEIAMFRIAQEALNNAQKHSRAGSATVHVEYGDTAVRLVVQDDGIGFDVEGSHSEFTPSGRFGLVGMNERAQLMGGVMQLLSVPGSGTTVTLDVPLSPGAEGNGEGR